MPRANRFYWPGGVWHITHRCHDQEFLLKFERDRQRWKYWLFQAKRRYGLSVLNYIATSNHVHLLLRDSGQHSISSGMQLVAGRVAQEYNQRKSRRGAFWEDRYFATAVSTDEHLMRCHIYIDLNMVRAGAVAHPSHWKVSGYNELQNPPVRYKILDRSELQRLYGFTDYEALRVQHSQWLESCLQGNRTSRESFWSESLAVGSKEFIERVRANLGAKVYHRRTQSVSTRTFTIQDAAY